MPSIPQVEQSLDHVAVAVHSIEESRRAFEIISGNSCTAPELLEAHGVRVAFVGAIELIEPAGPDTSVARYLEQRGQGLHHIAYRTENLDRELARLDASGIQLVDRTPRAGANGHRVAFLHPSATGGILVELVERPNDP